MEFANSLSLTIMSRNNESISEINRSQRTRLIPSFPLPGEEKGNTDGHPVNLWLSSVQSHLPRVHD